MTIPIPGQPMTFVVAVEDDEDGSVRMYVGARIMNLHTHIDDPAAVAELRAAWATAKHVVVNAPLMDDLCGCRQDIEPPGGPYGFPPQLPKAPDFVPDGL